MTTYFISGANRGIGLQLTKQFSADKENLVIATTRSLKNSKKLKELNRDNVQVIELDISAPLETIKEQLLVLNKIAPNGVDVVIQNAGILPEKNGDFSSINIDQFQKAFDVNTLGPIKTYQAIFPYWSKSGPATKIAVYVSSAVGLINNYIGFSGYGYGISKAGLNYFVKDTAFFHSKSENEALRSSISVAIHPGLVSTDMGNKLIAKNPAASSITPEQSGEYIAKLVAGLTAKDNGTFKNYDGTTVLW